MVTIAERNFKMFSTSTCFSLASGIKYSAMYLNLLCKYAVCSPYRRVLVCRAAFLLPSWPAHPLPCTLLLWAPDLIVRAENILLRHFDTNLEFTSSPYSSFGDWKWHTIYGIYIFPPRTCLYAYDFWARSLCCEEAVSVPIISCWFKT